MKLHKDICSARISRTSAEIFYSENTSKDFGKVYKLKNLHMRKNQQKLKNQHAGNRP